MKTNQFSKANTLIINGGGSLLALILSIVLSIFSITVEAQLPSLPTNANFYDYLDAYYSSPGYYPNDTSEGGSRTQHNRLASIWVPRLHPHGDFSVANKAIINYAQNFTPVTNSSINANWNCIGPSNTPANSNKKGVGQIHRITFSPNYAISDNTIYACSGFGGLWRTEDDGAYWQNVNTDALKISSVADVAISYDDINTIFIATGLADGGVTLEYGPNWGNTNPIYTIGIYRSLDYGETWHEINDGFIDKFYEKGGVVRKLTIDKNNPDILFAATSNGIYRTINACDEDEEPHWEMVYDGETDFDGDFRSIEFKPDDSNVLYASSINIFKSIDGGDNWDEITGNTTGLDFEDLALDGFYPERINLAVTPAPGAEDRIYAYIFGENETLEDGICSGSTLDFKSAYIYNFENGLWGQHKFQHGYNVKEWMALAVSPVNADIIFAYGALAGTGASCNIGVFGTYAEPAHPWIDYTEGQHGVYPDGHVLAFQPNVSNNPLLFFGSHGGISVLEHEIMYPPWPPPPYDPWEYRNNGLQNQLFWSFAHSNFEEGVYLTANQDCGIYKYKDNVWNTISSSGDGYAAKASYNNPDLFFHSRGNSIIASYNISTGSSGGYEFNKIPIDLVSLQKTLIPKTFPLVSFPNSNHDFLGFCELYKRNYDWPEDYTAEELWEIDSDIGKPDLLPHTRQITEVDYCQANPDVIYIATGGLFNENSTGLEPKLFKTTVGGNNGVYNNDGYDQVDYPVIGTDDFPVISGIAVHPTDPDKVWITMIGYDNIIERVLYTTDGGTIWNNADDNNSLPQLPINGIVYHYGSNDGLYIATDVGVYYKNAEMEDWIEYGEFPHVRVVELSINYCTQKISAATYGRALWEGDLVSAENPVCYEVKNGEVLKWDKPKALQTGVRILSGGELLVQDIVNMPFGGKIIVEAGGKLTIDGGKITNTCGKTWQGVELLGSSTSPQDPVFQGVVVMKNGGAIENATVGIIVGDNSNPNYSGGIIEATDAVFRNNIISVNVKPYNIYSKSIFSNCEFLTDDNWPHTISSPVTFVQLNNSIGYRFEGCTFKNENPEIFNTVSGGYGIRSINSEFVVNQIEAYGQPSVFENMYYGINAIAYTYEKVIEIENSTFINNYNGIYVGAVGNAWINSNSFTVPEKDPELNSSYGLYLDECTNYHIEGNTFTSIIPDYNAGLYVNNSGTDENMIYNNTFNNLYAASVFQDINRNNAIGGLCVKCNDYSDNIMDVSVVINDPYETPNHGIAQNQGSMAAEDDAPAGNTFTEYQDHVWDIYNETNSIVYIYHNEQSAPNVKLKPILLFGDVTTHENILAEYLKERSCAPTIDGGVGIKSTMLATEVKADSTSIAIEALTDGGDTDELNFDVQTAMPSQSLETRDMLLADSPNLSDTVMVSAIETENILPNAMVRDILVENPQSAKSAFVQNALDMRTDALPQYMRNEINLGADTLSEKEISEAALTFFKQAEAKAAISLYYNYRNDTLIVGIDSIAQLYIDSDNIKAQYHLAMLRYNQGDTIAADTIVVNIQYKYSLTSEQELERQDYAVLFNLLKQIDNNGLVSTDSLVITGLSNLMQNDNGMPSVYARTALIAVGEITYNEPLFLPDTSLKVATAIGDFSITIENDNDESKLWLQPNPAKDYFIATWELTDCEGDVYINIVTTTGRQIKSYGIVSPKNEMVITTANWQPGTYVVSIVYNGMLIESKKLNIVK